MAKFILIGEDEKNAGVLMNIEYIKFMHVLKLESKRYALQIIFGTNESYVSEEMKTYKEAMAMFDKVYTNIYGLIGPEGIPGHTMTTI
jgi:hypothetical protein